MVVPPEFTIYHVVLSVKNNFGMFLSYFGVSSAFDIKIRNYYGLSFLSSG